MWRGQGEEGRSEAGGNGTRRAVPEEKSFDLGVWAPTNRGLPFTQMQEMCTKAMMTMTFGDP